MSLSDHWNSLRWVSLKVVRLGSDLWWETMGSCMGCLYESIAQHESMKVLRGSAQYKKPRINLSIGVQFK